MSTLEAADSPQGEAVEAHVIAVPTSVKIIKSPSKVTLKLTGLSFSFSLFHFSASVPSWRVPFISNMPFEYL